MKTERNINDVLVLDFYDSAGTLFDYTADNEQEDCKEHNAVSENYGIEQSADIFLAERVLFTQRCLCFSVFVLWIFVLILAFRR